MLSMSVISHRDTIDYLRMMEVSWPKSGSRKFPAHWPHTGMSDLFELFFLIDGRLHNPAALWSFRRHRCREHSEVRSVNEAAVMAANPPSFRRWDLIRPGSVKANLLMFTVVGENLYNIFFTCLIISVLLLCVHHFWSWLISSGCYRWMMASCGGWTCSRPNCVASQSGKDQLVTISLNKSSTNTNDGDLAKSVIFTAPPWKSRVNLPIVAIRLIKTLMP